MGLTCVALAACTARTPTAATSSYGPDQMQKFAQCLREHGMNASADPQGHGVQIQGQGKEGKGQMDAATKACRSYAPNKDINPNDPKVRDRMLKMAQCMRAHGVNMPDPQPGQGLMIQDSGGTADHAKVDKANQACRHLLNNGSAQP